MVLLDSFDLWNFETIHGAVRQCGEGGGGGGGGYGVMLLDMLLISDPCDKEEKTSHAIY